MRTLSRSILPWKKKDYAEAENKTRIWEKKILSAKINIHKIGNFRGDSSFRDSNEYVLAIFSDHVIIYYKRLMLLLRSEKAEESQKIRDTYYKIHLRMDEADKILKAASEKFQMEFDRSP